MAIHKDLTGAEAIHEIMYVQSADPGAVGANKFWLDTTSGATLEAGAILKQRDAPDTGWTTRADIKTALDLKAALASPTFTGTPAAPTAAPGTNTTQIATTAFVTAAVTAGGGGVAFSGCLLRKAAAEVVANNTVTYVAFASEEYDTDSYHDNATNNSRITIPATGIYRVSGAVLWDTGTGALITGIQLNRTSYIVQEARNGSGVVSGVTLCATAELTVGDYIELLIYQNTGGNLSTRLDSYTCMLEIQQLDT